MASGADQKNPSGNRGNNQPQRNEFAESIIGRVLRQIEAANERGNTDNQALYEKILRGYDVMTNDQKAQLEELDKRHGNVAEALATMSGDTVANMQGLIDGTKTDVLTEAKARTDEVTGKFDAATSKLGELAQQAEGRVDTKGAEAAGRVQELAAGAKQEVADLGQQTADDVAGRGAAAREGVTGRMDKSIRDLMAKYRGAEGDATRTVRGGRDAIAGQYDALRGTDAAARQQAAQQVRQDFADQETGAAGRFGQARQDISQDTAAGVSQTGQRFAGGREDVRSEFGRARDTAQGISAGAEQRAGQLGQQTLQDLSARAEGRLGQLGEGYAELGEAAAGRAAATGQDIGGRIDALRGQAGEGFSGAIEDTGAAYGAGREAVAGDFSAAQAERAGRYGDRTQTGLNMYDQMGQESLARINRQFDESLAKRTAALNQSLANRGLGNTTVAQTMLSELQSESDQNRQQAIAQVEGQVRQQKAAAYERFTSQGMNAQDAMQASGLSAATQMTGQQLAAQQNLRGAGLQTDIGLGQAGIRSRESAATRGEQAGLQTGLAGLAQQAQAQQGISSAEQAVGRQALAGQLGALQQGTQAQMGLLGQGAGAAAGMTGQSLAAQQQMASQGLGALSNLAGARASAQQQAGMAGAAAGQQLAGQNLAAGTALGQAGLAARERGQAALEGQTQQARLAGLAAMASGQQQQRGADAALTGQQFGAEAQALGQGQQGVTSLAGQAFGAGANLEGQRFGQGAAMAGQGLGLQGANIGQGLSAFDRARQQESSIAAQLAGQGMAAQTGQMAQGFGTQAQLGQGQLGALERKQAEENMIKQRTLDFMGDTTIESPGWDAATNLALAAGQAGMGVGGGQGGMNPAMEAAMNQLAAQQRWMQGNVAANQQRAAQQQAANQAFQERLLDKQREERQEVRQLENEMALNRRKWEAEDAKFRQDWQRELNERDDAKFSGQMSQANKVREEQLKILEEAAKKLEDHTADWQSKYEAALKEGNIALADEIREGARKEAEALKSGYTSAKDAYQSTNDTLAQALEASASQRNQGLETINVDVTVDGDKVTITDKESGVEVIDGTGAASQGPEGGYPGGGPFYPPNQTPGGMGNEGGNTNQPGGGTTNQPGGGTTNQPGGGTTNQPGGGTTNQPGGGTTNQPGGDRTNQPGGEQPGGGTTNQPGQPGGGRPTPPPGVPPGSVYVEPGTNPGLPGGGWVGGGKIYTPEGQVMTKPMPNPPPVPTTPAGGGNQGGGGQPTGIPPWMLPGGEQPGGEQPGGEQPGGEQPGGGQPGGEQPGGGQPTGIPPWMLPTEGGEQPGGGGPVLTPPDVANMPWQMQPERMPWRNWGEYTQFMQEQLDPGGEQAALAAQMDDGMDGGFSGGGFGGGSAGGSLQGLAAQAQGQPQAQGFAARGNQAQGVVEDNGGQAAGGQPAQGNQLEAPRTDMNPAKYQAMMQAMIQPGMEMAGDIWNEQLQKQGEIVEQANEQSRKGQGIASGFPVPPPDVSFAAPQGGGQGNSGWQRQDNQGQQALDNLRRQFETMTPEQRMQNAGNFQRDMDRWQSNFGEGGNTREQVDLFNQIKEATGSQRLRGFADQNNPMQFNDRQLREQSRMQQGPEQKQELPMFGQEGYGDMIRQRRAEMNTKPTLAELRGQAEGTDAGESVSPTQETPLWQQKMTPDMTTRQKNQIANARYRHYKPTMPVGRDGLNKVEANARIREQNAAMRNPTTVNAGKPNQGQQPKQLSNRDRRLMNYTPPAKGRWNRQADSTRFNQLQGMNPKPSLRNVSNMAKPRMSLQQMYRN